MNFPGLFSIETNAEPSWGPAPLTPAMTEVLSDWGIRPDAPILQAEKPNRESSLFRVHSMGASYMLRCVPQSLSARTELQARILIEIDFTEVIKPARSLSGSYAELAGGLCWTATPFQSGALFDGRNGDLADIISSGASLIRVLSQWLEKSGSNSQSSSLHRPSHQFECWKELKGLHALSRWMGPSSHELVLRFPDAISAALELAASAAREPFSATLVHNDLQHANCLISPNGRAIFLDMEDICLERPQIALSHMIFKLLRHSVFKGSLTHDQAAELLETRLIPAAGLASVGLDDVDEFRRFSLLRSVSDLYLIKRAAHSNPDHPYLYDLDKKIHNIFETFVLTGGMP